MFGKKINGKESVNNTTASTIIGSGVVIEGNIQCHNSIRIDGKVIGNINCKEAVIVGPEGEIDGDLIALNAEIHGLITGTIQIEDLLLIKGKGVVNGDVTAGKLQVEQTANLNGQIHMKNHQTPGDILKMKKA